MKCLSITMLLCVITVKAAPSIEEIVRSGFYENRRDSGEDLTFTLKNQHGKPELITIDKSHVPTNQVLPHYAEVYFPVPARNFLNNAEEIHFETQGSFAFGHYWAPERDTKRIFWSIVEDTTGKKHTVPTARLMIRLDQEQLEETNYQENWSDTATDMQIELINGFFSINKNHVPSHSIFPQATELFFPLPSLDYSKDKENIDFKTNGRFTQGYYYAPETNSSRVLWSIVEDIYGKRYSVPTARLMIHANTLRTIQSRRRSK